MIKLEIHIGEEIQKDGSKKPSQIIRITEKQFGVIELFAHTRKDKNLNTIYILNECEFTIHHIAE